MATPISKKYFHFTLGPVQGFVAQARRTRDLWAGSFLLSYLSAVAIKETKVQLAENTILFPVPDPAFLEALEGKGADKPQQGSIPNRFKAEVSENFDPLKVTLAVQQAWKAIADAVLQKDLAHRLVWQERQQHNWETQIQHFWDMAWALTDDKADSAILDKRKNWRSHYQPAQLGDKCMMMEGYQELSAEPRPNTKAQKAFWEDIQKDVRLDLRENEKLCAMAFVKRRFTKVFSNLSVTMPSGWTLKGWPLPESVPSVQYLAAAHWLESLVKMLDDPSVKEAADTYYEVAKKRVSHSEYTTRIHCIEQAQRQTENHKLTNLDGAAFYETLLESGSAYDAETSSALLKGLKSLKRAIKQSGKANNLDALPPFYAILLMDGDSLGAQMSDEAKQPTISKALGEFTQTVPDIIQRHNGFLIYAGGDDVLAILPLQDAIPAAIACRKAYAAAFQKGSVKSTLSGAIEFVHIKSPLMKAVHQSHKLLDDIAKDQTGRDALAIRINKPGNENAVWSMPWQYALTEDGQRLVIEELTDYFTMKGVESGFSSKFIYSLRDKYAQFHFEDFSQSQKENLIFSDYLQSDHAITDKQEAKLLIHKLLDQMAQYSRDNVNEPFKVSHQKVDIDPALIARFLAQKGIE